MGHEAIEALMELADTSAGREKASEIAQQAQQIGAEALAAVSPANAAATVNGDAGAREGSRRRTRRSAALMGLALSMGATDALSLMQPLPAVAQEDSGNAQADAQSSAQNAGLNLKLSPLKLEATAPELAAVTVNVPQQSPSALSQDLMTHVVQSGETLTRIASTYGVPVKNLISLNRLPASGAIIAGQELQVPAIATAVPQTAEAVSTQSVAVQPEAQANPQTDALARLRNQREQLKLSLNQFKPADSAASIAAPQPSVELADLVPYRIQAGDTLDTIAQAYQVPRSQIIAVNQLENPNVLRVDQVLGIPRTKGMVKPEAAKATVQPVAVKPALAQPTLLQPTLTQPTLAQPPVQAPARLAQAAPLALEVIPAPETAAPQAVSIPTVMVPQAQVANSPSAQTGGIGDALRPTSSGSYRVQLGDTLAQIARQHGLTLGELSNANGLNNPNTIYVGQLLTIPGVRSEAGGQSGQVVGRPRLQLEAVPETEAPTPVAVQPPIAAAVPTVPSLRSLSAQTSSQAISLKVEPAANPPAPTPRAIETRAAAPLRSMLSEVQMMRRGAQPADPVADVPVPSKMGSIDLAVVPPAAPQPIQQARAEVRQQVNPEFKAATPGKPAQLVASANLGSNSYEPLVQTLLGRAVSPTLPMLTSDPFLPDSSLKGMIWPAKGVVSSRYGWRWGRMHKGIDVAGPIGTPIVAVQSGVVTYSRFNDGGYGNLVEITHPDGSLTLYAHNDRLLVREGQRVSQGQQIAELGNTGFSTGPHLHFEYHPAGQGAVDPIAFLPSR